MKVNINVNFEITKRYLLIICSVFILCAGGIVYAFNSGVPTTMGHSFDEMGPGFADIGSGEILIEGDGSRVLTVAHPGGTNALFVEGSAEVTRDLDVSGPTTFTGGVSIIDPTETGLATLTIGGSALGDEGILHIIEGVLDIGRSAISFDGGSIRPTGAGLDFVFDAVECFDPNGCNLCITTAGRLYSC